MYYVEEKMRVMSGKGISVPNGLSREKSVTEVHELEFRQSTPHGGRRVEKASSPKARVGYCMTVHCFFLKGQVQGRLGH